MFTTSIAVDQRRICHSLEIAFTSQRDYYDGVKSLETDKPGRRERRRKKPPRYRLLADVLRRELVEGELADGARLPGLRELARRLDVSTFTVRQALRALEKEGRVHCVPGLGAFVRPTIPRRRATDRVTVAFATIEIESVFAGQIATGIEQACRRRGWSLEIHNARFHPEVEARILSRLPESGADGAVILPLVDKNNLEGLFRLKFVNFPFVLVDRSIPGLPVDVAEPDHEKGAYLATQYLLRHGHRRVFMLTVAPGLTSSADARMRGYEQALTDHGIRPRPEWRITLDPQVNVRRAAGERPLKMWYDTVLTELKNLDKPAAFFALHAIAGRALVEACRDVGLRIPQDVSVVSFDDTEFMEAWHPPITVIAQRSCHVGETALELLERRLQGDKSVEPRHVLIDVDLIERQSVSRPPGAAHSEGV